MLQTGNPETLKLIKLKNLLNSKNGGLAQLARAPALQAGGQRFESVILHSIVATLYKKRCKRSLTYWTTQDSSESQSSN